MTSPIEKFAKDAATLDAANRLLAYAKEIMGHDAHHFSVANALFGASLKAIEEVDGAAGVGVYTKIALETITDLEGDDGGYN